MFTEKELESENWKEIDGYDGMYQVSDLGRVRSLKYGKTRVLKGGSTPKGYRTVLLYNDKKVKCFYVHRLVAQAFIPNDDERKIYINHIDECKQNNRASNLEYCTAQYNATYNDIHHRRITKIGKLKDLYRPELTIDENLLIFKENGIECCGGTVVNLRKELNLDGSRPQPKRRKIEKLYNQNLSINENLEIFRANGIECCEWTVKQLRKDLGLTRKYTKPN